MPGLEPAAIESVDGHINRQVSKCFYSAEGWRSSTLVNSLFSLISIVNILALMITYSFGLIFEEIDEDATLGTIMKTVQIAALPVFSL